MPARSCEVCGRSFWQGRGRPAKKCPEHVRYGGAHQARRAAEVDSAYGQPCCRCGETMQPGQEIHLDHADGGGPADYLGDQLGLGHSFSHARCNEAGNRRRPAVAAVPGDRVVKVYDPGPLRTNVEHYDGCDCMRAALQLGVQPSRCWLGEAPHEAALLNADA